MPRLDWEHYIQPVPEKKSEGDMQSEDDEQPEEGCD